MKKQMIAAAVLAALVGGNMAHAEHHEAKKVEREKCYGIAKAGKNDCASKDGKNSCAGSSKRDNDANDWIYVTKGECTKQGGKTE